MVAAVEAAGDPADAEVRDTLGAWLLVHPSRRGILDELIGSDSVWERRTALDGFLDTYAPVMPRTMLRYAIERHAAPERRDLLSRGTYGSGDGSDLRDRPEFLSDRSGGR
nr:hypothetical protein [Kineosporia mesophila]